MGKQVPKVNTPVSDDQMAQAIISVWRNLFGTSPSKDQVNIIMAQNAIETGNDRKSMHNYNVGNITVGKTNYDYFLGGDWTYADKAQTVKKPITQKFRAYKSLEEGVEDYLKLLSTNQRYARAWQHIVNPNVRAYSKALREGGYYEAKEEEYTAGLLNRVNRFNKSQTYETAMSGKSQSNQLAGLDNMIQNILNQFNVAASDRNLKKIYKTMLPNHNILIQISANDRTNVIEFSRVLCTALDEDLLSSSYPHTDGNLVEIECSIAGPQKECYDAVYQMTQAVADTFKDATSKIGGVEVKFNVIMDKKSSYQPISPKTADTNHRKFLLKFI